MWPLLILSVLAPAPIHPSTTEAVPIFQCDFSVSSDRNFDDWPDEWTRQSGSDYPFYIRAAIEDETTADTTTVNRCLAIRMDGGNAAMHYKNIPVSKTFSYVLSCRIQTEALPGHDAFVRISALNARGEVVEHHDTRHISGTGPWVNVEIGPWAPHSDDVEALLISLHVEARAPGALFGTAWFDDISLARLPRIQLACEEKFNLYLAPAKPLVRCVVSGISNRDSEVTFELFDEHHRRLESATQSLNMEPMTVAGSHQEEVLAYSGETSWSPAIKDVGFYSVKATVTSEGGSALQRTLTFAVMHDFPAPPAGIYGWCLPEGEEKLHVKQLAQLVAMSGVNWVKFPVWFSDHDTAKADRIAWFAERLSNLGIQLVAVLGSPPTEAAHDLLGDTEGSAIALVFAETQVWQKLLNPVMLRLSLKVRWWQIGADHDASFVGFPQLEQRIREIRDHFEQFGQEVHLGLAWNWLDERPANNDPPWKFLSYFSDPPLTAREMENYIDDERRQARPAWMLLQPLTREHDLETRARDLVLRMVAAKKSGAEAAFHPDPFDSETGLLNADGSPQELFLPWRTAAMLLANAQYLGEWHLPSGSHNRVFSSGSEALIVMWNDRPTTEELYVGESDHVQQIDLWGRTKALEILDRETGPRHVIHVNTLPTFIVGANLPISRMRIEFAFDKQQLSSAFGEQTAALQFRNCFPQGISGEIRLRTPDAWTVQPERIRFKAAVDEQQTHPFQIFLRNNAPSGPQAVQLDFDIRADRQYEFSICRTIQVGSNDIAFEIFPSISADGNLVVEQHLINRSDQEVSFNCMLFVPGVGRERRQVLHATRGRRTDIYVVPNGTSLIGKTLWLRAEEIGGSNRLLNYHVEVEQ